MLAARLDDPSSVPGTCMVNGKNSLSPAVLCLSYTHAAWDETTHIHLHYIHVLVWFTLLFLDILFSSKPLRLAGITGARSGAWW